MSESVNCLDVVELFFLENNFIDSETKTSIVEKCSYFNDYTTNEMLTI